MVFKKKNTVIEEKQVEESEYKPYEVKDKNKSVIYNGMYLDLSKGVIMLKSKVAKELKEMGFIK